MKSRLKSKEGGLWLCTKPTVQTFSRAGGAPDNKAATPVREQEGEWLSIPPLLIPETGIQLAFDPVSIAQHINQMYEFTL